MRISTTPDLGITTSRPSTRSTPKKSALEKAYGRHDLSDNPAENWALYEIGERFADLYNRAEGEPYGGSGWSEKVSSSPSRDGRTVSKIDAKRTLDSLRVAIGPNEFDVLRAVCVFGVSPKRWAEDAGRKRPEATGLDMLVSALTLSRDFLSAPKH